MGVFGADLGAPGPGGRAAGRRMDTGRVLYDQALVGTVAGEIDVLTVIGCVPRSLPGSISCATARSWSLT